MSVGKALLILACISAGATIIAIERRRQLGTPAPNHSHAPDSLLHSSAPASAAPIPAPQAKPTTPPHPQVPALATLTQTQAQIPLEPAERARLQRELNTWSFSVPPNAATETLALDDAHLVARWGVRRSLFEHALALEPPPPEHLSEVRLANQNRLWARRAERRGDRWVLTLLSDASSTLPADRVESVREVPWSRYLMEEADAARADIQRLRTGSASERAAAFGRALTFRMHGELDGLFDAWCEADGPRRLAGALPALQARHLLAAADLVLGTSPAELETPAAAPAVPAPTRAAAPAPARSEILTPTSIEDLARRIPEVRRRLARPLDADARRALMDQLLAWEAWLTRQGIGASEEAREKVDQLGRDLQLLRLDLLKGQGF